MTLKFKQEKKLIISIFIFYFLINVVICFDQFICTSTNSKGFKINNHINF